MIENGKVIRDFPTATGSKQMPTRYGHFKVLKKIDWAWGIYHIWMPYWMTIYYAGSSENGIHGVPSKDGKTYQKWDTNIGTTRRTYGCIMSSNKNAEILYNWAPLNMPVDII